MQAVGTAELGQRGGGIDNLESAAAARQKLGDDGLIVSHTESWSISAIDAFASTAWPERLAEPGIMIVSGTAGVPTVRDGGGGEGGGGGMLQKGDAA